MSDAPGDGDGPPSPPPPSDRPPENQPPPPAGDDRPGGPYPGYPPPPSPPYPPYPPAAPYWQPGPSYSGPQPSPYGSFGPPPGAPRLAPFGLRMAAWLIDWLITGVVSAVVLVPVHAVHEVTALNGTSSLAVSNQGIALTALVVIIYGTVCIGSRRGQTIGMRALRLRAVDATTGASVTYARALGRALVEYAFLVLLFIPWVVDMLFPLWDARRQTLHDKAVNTVVLRL
jgi:uncharacterized RDD family membrane protein YckC